MFAFSRSLTSLFHYCCLCDLFTFNFIVFVIVWAKGINKGIMYIKLWTVAHRIVWIRKNLIKTKHRFIFIFYLQSASQPLQHFSKDYVLASYTTQIMCNNFICEQRNLQFNIDSERQIFAKFFHGRFILHLVRNLLRGNHQRNIIFHILFWYLTCNTILGFTSCKTTHYLIDSGDFQYILRS